MKKGKFKKVNILGVTILFISIIVFISYIFVVNKVSYPFDPIRDMRDTVENYELLEIKKTENGTMVYSVGKVNDGDDNMYFVDMVKKSLMGYKWLGGGGHINRDIRESKDFTFSAQLLNENQNINPTVFGVLSDIKIRKVTVLIVGNKLYEGVIYDRKEENEKFYYISLDNNISDYRYFIFTVTYDNGERVEFTVSDDEITKFQEGYWLHFQ